jgi:hypothetical protein
MFVVGRATNNGKKVISLDKPATRKMPGHA